MTTREEQEKIGRDALIKMIKDGGPPAFILGGAIALAETFGNETEREMSRVADAALKRWIAEHKRGLH